MDLNIGRARRRFPLDIGRAAEVLLGRKAERVVVLPERILVLVLEIARSLHIE